MKQTGLLGIKKIILITIKAILAITIIIIFLIFFNLTDNYFDTIILYKHIECMENSESFYENYYNNNEWSPKDQAAVRDAGFHECFDARMKYLNNKDIIQSFIFYKIFYRETNLIY